MADKNEYLTERDVRGIATYTRIALTDDEVADMTVDLNNIIETLQPIREYDLTGVEPTFHPIAGLSNVMRDDVPKEGLPHAIALAGAPDIEDGQFKIPPILSGGDA
ncbi:MAG: Asp-tRNA(Asn)/Glu-tRNA(Gln) amidotransferase subunit GatC [Coriobacteriales bacterium]|jgi:aspartyl-tRNA(Asn)/glutamyl-tRNA(Gln) amidotransferase subunit C|nr:Asp-tRNA(Asn)/Glu-tRNA(Gln) amidotransferase subunit GatC [Coriobacteriales bacterium]